MPSNYPVINVTKTHAEESVVKSSSHCMVAEAIRDTFEDAEYISVDLQTIRFSRKDKRYIYLTPRSVQKAVVLFDSGTVPKPFRFELRSPQIINRDGPKGERKMTKRTSTTQRQRPTIIGGSPPPHMSMRREFGLRGLQI